MRAEIGKPAIGGTVGFALGKNDRVVLVHGEKAFAATGGAKHEHRVGDRRIALARVAHALLAESRGAPGERAQFARNDRGDIARVHALGKKPSRYGWQLRPSAAEFVDVRRFVDLVTERDRASGTQSQEVARR